ncbi:MAG: SGNH/GDSL hydrolase family protein [Desulfobacterota bacterium]|nr:SGNH/GDSL hydrolase family protein [Thermodesulfobacteriota bacterium]
MARIAFSIPYIAKHLRADEDYTYRRAWVERHQKTGLAISYKFDVYDQTKGWIAKPNLRNLTVFYDKILNTNAKGFRGAKNYSYKKTEGIKRILILGDSFAFGDEVSDNQTFAHYLQEMLPESEIINLGMHGYGHDQMLILLKEEGVNYEPDIVIIGFLPFDMPRNLLEFRDFAKPKFLLKNGKLDLVNSPVPRPEDILVWDWMRPRTIDIFALVWCKIKSFLGIRKQEMEAITMALLKEMVRTIRTINAIPVIVYLPAGEEIYVSDPLLPYEEFMYKVCEDNNAVCFSARPFFKEKVAAGTKFRIIGHWDSEGHRLVAHAIKKHLAELKLINMN